MEKGYGNGGGHYGGKGGGYGNRSGGFGSKGMGKNGLKGKKSDA